MKLKPAIVITAELEITDGEAEVLEYLCSYDLATYFADKCSTRFTADYIKKTLNGIRDNCRKIIETKNKAMKAGSE